MTNRSKLGRIDDPYDAAKKAYPATPDDVGAEVGFRLLAHLPKLGPLLGVLNEVREYFSGKARQERLETLIEAVNDKVDYLSQ